MTSDKIKELMDKKIITQVGSIDELAKLSEAELMDKKYASQVCILNSDSSVVDPEAIVENEPMTDPEAIVEDEPMTDPEAVVEDESETTTVEGEVVEDDVKPVVDEGDEEE